ncbi:hypothetical protein, partial [Klebsiella pneumoniae]|uniref:hypothetical protein n=1 Tax=Klebsiella pneumoniae TaxID=573 RepID=UPI0022B5FF35
MFSAMSAFKWHVHCENPTSPARLAGEIARVPLKNMHYCARPIYNNNNNNICHLADAFIQS